MQDAVAVLEAVAGSDAPPTVLLGHSMGGAIAVHAAASGRVRSLAGLLVVDVVEGSALQVTYSCQGLLPALLWQWADLLTTLLQALPVMPQILSQRPGSFSSLDAAIEWALASGTPVSGASQLWPEAKLTLCWVRRPVQAAQHSGNHSPLNAAARGHCRQRAAVVSCRSFSSAAAGRHKRKRHREITFGGVSGC